MKNLTVAKKLYFTVGIILGILVIVSAISSLSQRYLVGGYQRLSEAQGAQREVSSDSLVQLGAAVRAYKDYLIHGDYDAMQRFNQAVRKADDLLVKYQQLTRDAAERTAAENARKELENFAEGISSAVVGREQTTDVKALDNKLGREIDAQFRKALSALDELTTKNYEHNNDRLKSVATGLQGVQMLLTAAALVLGFIVSTLIIRSIIKPIAAVKNAAERASTGDLSREILVSSSDEIGEMAKSFNRMIVSLRDIVARINATTITLATNSGQLSTTAEDLNKGAGELASQADQVVTAMTEVSQTIMDMAKNASHAADTSRTSSETAARGKSVVNAAADEMLTIARTVQGAAVTIEELGKSSAQIGEIVAVINGIADQTNLLALNAAIEAARAGEQGRGFAVVADEVRKLAERTGQATKDIAQRIASIQTAAEESVLAMKKGSETVDKGVGMAKEASGSLESIVAASAGAMDMVQRIAAATEEQSAASEEVSHNMENISGIITRTATATEQIKQSSVDLARLSSDLHQMTAWFKLDGASAAAPPAPEDAPQAQGAYGKPLIAAAT